MRIERIFAVIASLALMSSLSGCAMFNKGTVHYSRTTTIGKELIDLKEAKEKGVISDEEYFKTKKDILEGGPLKMEMISSQKK